MLFGLGLDEVAGGGPALFALPPPTSKDDLLACFFVLGSPFGGCGACFFAVLALLETATAWACCLQLAFAGVQTIPLMITPRRIVSRLTFSLLSGLSRLKGSMGLSLGLGLVTLLGGVGLTTLGGGEGGPGPGGCGGGGGLMVRRTGDIGRVVISSTASSMTWLSEGEGWMGLADCGGLEITSDEEADLDSSSRELLRFFLLGTGGGTGSTGDGGRLTHRLRRRERIEGKKSKRKDLRQHQRGQSVRSGEEKSSSRRRTRRTQGPEGCRAGGPGCGRMRHVGRDRLALLILPVYWR